MKRLFICLLLLALCSSAAAFAEGKLKSLCDTAGIKNPDVVGWLEIPGAQISLPVLRHPQDDAFYASRGADGSENAAGALYIQAKYNAADFQDPVTIVYGKSTQVSHPFGMLQEKFSGSFDECRDIYLHLPEDTLEYRVFAAVPYSSMHILHYYDFKLAKRYNSFFESLFSVRALGMHLDESARPDPQERVLILSTSVRGDKTQRYLVAAKLVTH